MRPFWDVGRHPQSSDAASNVQEITFHMTPFAVPPASFALLPLAKGTVRIPQTAEQAS